MSNLSWSGNPTIFECASSIKYILLFSSVLFPNKSPELIVVDAGIQYGGFEKKYAKKIVYS